MSSNKFLIFIILISKVVVSQVPAYYSSIDFGQSGEALKSDLTTLISGHTEFPYSSSSTDTWDILQQSDILSGDNVLLIYGYDDSGDSITDRLRDKDDECSFSGSCVGYWNREHVYPKSLATPDLETDSAGAGTDLHNLRAADSQMNSTRNNNEFETGSGNSGLTTNGFYPGDEYKGDVARIIMYMYTRYPSQCAANNVGYGSNAHNSNIPDIFLEWNEADPVSAFETARNNKIAEYQGNRNPFVDNAFLAYLIWGGPSITDAWGTTQDPRIQFSSSSSENETDATFNTTIAVTMSSYDAAVTISVSVNGSSTAEAGDYTLNTSSLTFNGNGTQNISLDINNDNDNDDETIILDVSITSDAADPDTANLVVSQHTITIVDDEGPIIITEIADPNNNDNGKYIEIYNSSNKAADLSTYYLIRWTNGNTNPQSAKTTLSSECGSSLPAKTICIISEQSESTFSGIYGVYSDGDAPNGGAAGSNGDDNIAIVTIASGVTYDETNSSTYTVIDMFGVAGEDGSGTAHEFEDGRAERKASSTIPSSSWVSSDWNVENDTGGGGSTNNPQTAPDDYDPGYWIGATSIDAWNGLSSTAWATDNNWASGAAPANGDNVFIRDSSNDPIISTTGVQVTNLTVESSGSLTINAGNDLTVSGNFSNSGTVTLNSASDSYSSLIVQGTSSGNIIYNRYVNSLSNGEGWDLIGSPVNGLQISSFVTTNDSPLATNGSQYAIGVYDNSVASGHADEWINYTSSTVGSTQFTPGKGYSMATDSGATLAFTGTVDVDDTKTIAIEDHTDGSGTVWNLIANPYPSFITIGPTSTTDTFLEVNEDVIDDTYTGVYGYDAETSNDARIYDPYNNSTNTKMAPGQGFMVAARSTTSATITFKEEMQTTSTGDDFIAGDALNDSYEVLLKLYYEDNVKGQTKLYFKDILTLGLDKGWDAGAFDQNAAIMTRLLEEDEGHGLAINAMSTDDMDDVVIPLVINEEAGQEFRVNLHTSTIGEINIYLEDTELSTLTLLNEEDFVMTPTSDLEGIGRFFIHLTADTLSDGEVNTSLLNAYKKVDQNYITIEGLSTQVTSTKVSLYNILGTKIMDTKLDNTLNTQMISTNGLSTGIYVIKLESGVNQLTKKLIIK